MRLGQLSTSSPRSEFQSTHPVRGATQTHRRVYPHRPYFNPRTPCGVRHAAFANLGAVFLISIHAPRTGCDYRSLCFCALLPYFNPRTPCGVRRRIGITQRICPIISIHAPRAGCDPPFLTKRIKTKFNFNPRTPCGVRRQTCTTWFAPIFATLPNQMYVCLHYTCFTTLFQPKTWFSAVFQRCEAPRESMSAPASHRVKASAAPPAHRSAWRRYAQRGSDSYSQDCKSAGCPSPG